MALFRRRKSEKPAEPAPAQRAEAGQAAEEVEADATAAAAPEASEPAPEVTISVQQFRGVGAAAGGEVSLEPDEPKQQPATPTVAPQAVPPQADVPRGLPFAPAMPPAQTETVPGMKDNVLLREALKGLSEKPTNEQLLGVLRQMMQGHLFLRVHGDVKAQLAEGKNLQIGVIRDGDRSFMLAFSSAGALQQALKAEADPSNSSAVAQPVAAVLSQAVQGGFTGLVIDTASSPHRAVFPTEVLKQALDQADPTMRVKVLLAAPREQDTIAKVAEALSTTKMWIAVNTGEGQFQDGQSYGIAEARLADGRRFLQLFTHPLEIVVLGRGDRPVPFSPEQLSKVMADQSGLAGVLVDAAGPSLLIEREALIPALAFNVPGDSQ